MGDITLISNKELSDLQVALNLIKENLDTYLEFQQYQAIITKNKYDEFVKQGFTPEQALELCKVL